MNSFLNKNKLWLSFLGLAMVIVLLAFVFRPKVIHYQLNAKESLKLLNDQQALAGVNDLSGKQLIDIRSAELFAQGHPENAVNVPVRQLLEKGSVELFDRLLENGQTAVLCGSDELQATAPWLLLQQLGYTNVKHFKGGLSEKGEFEVSEISSTEIPILNPAEMQVKTEQISKVENTSKKKPETVIPVKKEVSSGGGC